MVRILICIKQAIDVSQLRADSATRHLILSDAPKKISDFDKNALEEAIRIKEKFGGEVLTVTAGPEDAKPSRNAGGSLCQQTPVFQLWK